MVAFSLVGEGGDVSDSGADGSRFTDSWLVARMVVGWLVGGTG